MNQELMTKRLENNKLDTGNHDREIRLQQFQANVNLLEQDKARLLADFKRQEERANTENQLRIRLEQELEEKVALVKKREEAVRNISSELLKGNEIIKKFQDQVKAEHHKVKLSAQVIEQQENVLAQKDEELNNVREELRKAKETAGMMNNERAGTDLEHKRLNDKIGDLERKLRTNEAVIAWLNKQLTIAQARDPGLRLGPPPDGLTTFTPSAMTASSTPMADVADLRGSAKASQEETILGSKTKKTQKEK